MRRFLVASILISLLMTSVLASAGCGGNSGGVTSDQYAKVEKGMTLDQVEALLGTPPRSHRQGPANNPLIIWYYNKSEGEGLLKITFENAKVTGISPYDTSISPEE